MRIHERRSPCLDLRVAAQVDRADEPGPIDEVIVQRRGVLLPGALDDRPHGHVLEPGAANNRSAASSSCVRVASLRKVDLLREVELLREVDLLAGMSR